MPILRSPLNLQHAHQGGIPGLTVGNGHGILKHVIDDSLKALIVEEPLSPRTSSCLGSRHNLRFLHAGPCQLTIFVIFIITVQFLAGRRVCSDRYSRCPSHCTGKDTVTTAPWPLVAFPRVRRPPALSTADRAAARPMPWWPLEPCRLLSA